MAGKLRTVTPVISFRFKKAKGKRSLDGMDPDEFLAREIMKTLARFPHIVPVSVSYDYEWWPINKDGSKGEVEQGVQEYFWEDE